MQGREAVRFTTTSLPSSRQRFLTRQLQTTWSYGHSTGTAPKLCGAVIAHRRLHEWRAGLEFLSRERNRPHLWKRTFLRSVFRCDLLNKGVEPTWSKTASAQGNTNPTRLASFRVRNRILKSKLRFNESNSK